jgi:serine phosphatase RsbU (regulator of sigma subunit)
MVDHVKMSETRHGVALGDVAGKGLGAALFTVKLQSTLRAFAPDVPSLAELGRKLNEVFYRDKVPNIFASLVFVELNSDSSTVRVLNAGHVLPILLHADKGTALEPGGYNEVPGSGPGLGIIADAEYKEQSVEIGAGETLVIYSDGVTDARSAGGEFFGTERFLQRLSLLKGLTAEQTGERILRDVDFFTSNSPLYDDLSIVIVRRAAVS